MSEAEAVSTAIAPVNGHGGATIINSAMDQVATEERLFELAQRKAKIYAQSALVPKIYQNNIGNVLIADNMARRMGADTLMVMQNLYVVHGNPGWSAQFLVACFNQCGRFSAIKYRFEGEPNTNEYGCVAYCTELSSGEVIEGTKITWAMANAEGWVNKTGSKWKTMPEQMFRYRAGTFLIRSTAPEIGMGLMTKDELEDIAPANGNGQQDAPKVGLAGVKERLIGQTDPEREPVDSSVIDLSDEAVEQTVAEVEAEIADHVDPSIHEAPAEDVIDVTDLEEETDDAEPNAIEKLRADVNASLEELDKKVRKELFVGKPGIGQMDEEQLRALLAEAEAAKG